MNGEHEEDSFERFLQYKFNSRSDIREVTFEQRKQIWVGATCNEEFIGREAIENERKSVFVEKWGWHSI